MNDGKCARCGCHLGGTYFSFDGSKYCLRCGPGLRQCPGCFELFSEHDTHALLNSGRVVCARCRDKSEQMVRRDKERIICAAVWYPDDREYGGSSVVVHGDNNYDPLTGPRVRGLYVLGRRHGNAMATLMRLLGVNYDESIGKRIEQGFVTNHGRFLSRTEAYTAAQEYGQFVPDKTRRNLKLFSEDIY